MKTLYSVVAVSEKCMDCHISFAYFNNEEDAEAYKEILLDCLNRGIPSFLCLLSSEWFELEYFIGSHDSNSHIHGRCFNTLEEALEFLPVEIKDLKCHLEGLLADFLTIQQDNNIKAPDMTLDEIYEIQRPPTCLFYSSQVTA
jgi:hypothetical protein